MNIKSILHTSGFVLVDVLLATALGVFFIACITYTSINSENIFYSSKEKNYMLGQYEKYAYIFEHILPNEHIEYIIPANTNFGTTTMNAHGSWYGNERIQTDVHMLMDSRHRSLVQLNSVRSYPFPEIQDVVGTSLCTVNFSLTDRVGSYRFQKSKLYNTNPKKITPVIDPIVIPNYATIPFTDIEVRNNIIYISTDSNVSADPDIFVVDIDNHNNPQILSSINTGPGLASIAVADNRVFAAATSIAAQLHIIRYDSLRNPFLEKKYTLPLPYATATPPFASSIFYNKKFVYLGTEKWDGEEFSVIDVSDTVNPQKISGVEIGNKILDIVVRGDDAYIATAGEYQFIRINIQDPHNPIIVDRFSPSGWQRQEGKVISLFEDTARLGRTSGGFNIKQDHELFSGITSATSVMSSYNASADIAGGIYGIISDRSFIYSISKLSQKEFVISDHSLSTTTNATIALPVSPQAMTCDMNTIYIISNTTSVIYKVFFTQN